MTNEQAIKLYEDTARYEPDLKDYTELKLIVETKDMPKLVEFMNKLKGVEHE